MGLLSRLTDDQARAANRWALGAWERRASHWVDELDGDLRAEVRAQAQALQVPGFERGRVYVDSVRVPLTAPDWLWTAAMERTLDVLGFKFTVTSSAVAVTVKFEGRLLLGEGDMKWYAGVTTAARQVDAVSLAVLSVLTRGAQCPVRLSVQLDGTLNSVNLGAAYGLPLGSDVLLIRQDEPQPGGWWLQGQRCTPVALSDADWYLRRGGLVLRSAWVSGQDSRMKVTLLHAGVALVEGLPCDVYALPAG